MTTKRPHAFHGLEIEVRTLTGARALRIVHPAGQRIPPHRHDWPLLTLPALGGYEEETDDGSVGVTGPAVVLHPPGRCHANCIHPLGMETFSIEFDPGWLRLSRTDALFDRSYYWIGGTVALASRRLAKLWSDSEVSETELQRATALFLRTAHSAPSVIRPPWLSAVQREISGGQERTAGRIASALGIHPRWLAHAYRQAIGEGLHDTILRRRVEQAAHLLRSSDRRIADVAFDSGFCDQSHLNRALRRFTGRTPAQLQLEREPLQALLT